MARATATPSTAPTRWLRPGTNPYVVPQRNAGAQWFLPNYNEWYKAAYLKNDGLAGSSWQYPTASNSDPSSTPPPGPSNAANVSSISGTYATTHGYFDPALNYLTDVGAYKHSASPYGTFDQAGNVWEWDDGAVKLGGGFDSQLFVLTRNYLGSGPSASYEDYDAGFRLATINVPEGTTLALVLVAVGVLPCVGGRKQIPQNRRYNRRDAGCVGDGGYCVRGEIAADNTSI